MHKSPSVLTLDLKRAAEQINVGKTYYHYKKPDNFYKVIHLAVMESDDSVCIIYQAQYGDKFIFVRPLNSWLEKIEWHGEIVDRFTLVG